MPETQFELLNEKNYVDWHYVMEVVLIEKHLWDIVDRTEGCPTGTNNSKAVRTYVKKHQVAWAKIILHIEPSQLPHAHFSDPMQIWEKLEKVHHACGFATHLALQCEFLYMIWRNMTMWWIHGLLMSKILHTILTLLELWLLVRKSFSHSQLDYQSHMPHLLSHLTIFLQINFLSWYICIFIFDIKDSIYFLCSLCLVWSMWGAGCMGRWVGAALVSVPVECD